jgi:hypothetical protein
MRDVLAFKISSKERARAERKVTRATEIKNREPETSLGCKCSALSFMVLNSRVRKWRNWQTRQT